MSGMHLSDLNKENT